MSERELELGKRSLSFVLTSGARSSGFVEEVPHRLLRLAHPGQRGWEEADDKTRPPAWGGIWGHAAASSWTST